MPLLIHLLMTLPTPAHRQRRIHLHIVTRQIQTNQSLKQNRPPWKCACEEHQQTCCCAAISDHIQNGAEFCGLLEFSRCHAVEGVQEAGDAVEEGTGAGVEGHIVEGCYGEDYAGVA